MENSKFVFSRFVIWNSASLDACCCKDQEWIIDVLNSRGLGLISDLQGLAPSSCPSQAAKIEEFLLGYKLGMLVHTWWPPKPRKFDTQKAVFLDESVAILDLSVRPSNCLIHAGIATVGDLIERARQPSGLLALPNMGRKSLAEIYEKLALLAPQPSDCDKSSCLPSQPNSICLAMLMSFEDCGISKNIAKALKREGVLHVPDLVSRGGLSHILKPAHLKEVQICLNPFGLRLEMTLPVWIRDHFHELRHAFEEDIQRSILALKPPVLVTLANEEPTPVLTCIEEEFETLLVRGLSDKKAQIVRRFLGWDGGTGATLEETGREFGVSRERIRQVIGGCLRTHPSIPLACFSRAIDCARECVPCLAERAEAALLQSGLVRSPVRLECIESTAQMLGFELPWTVENWNGIRILVNESSSDQIREFHAEARRRVSHYGLTRKSYVAAELSNKSSSENSNLYCSLLEGLCWLDEVHDWFWFPTKRNSLLNRLAKVLRVTTKLTLTQAHAAVLRDRRMHDVELSQETFRALIGVVSWCRLEGDYVSADESLPKNQQDEDTDSAEVILVNILQQYGPVMRTPNLRRIAAERGVGNVIFYRLLSDSNLIVQHGLEVYGLIGSEGTLDAVQAHQGPRSLQDLDAPELTADLAQSEHVLEGCDPANVRFPLQLLRRVLLRSDAVCQHGPWSIVELNWTERDRTMLRQWSESDEIALQNIPNEYLCHGLTRFDGTEAVALTFLACCADIARTYASEGEMWPFVQARFSARLRSQLFHAPGVPKARIRQATERICTKLKIRHLFGREGEQSWLRTVFLQFGITRSGWRRLPWWLGQISALPVAIEDLLSSTTLRSESFGQFWRTLQKYRAGQVSRQQAFDSIRENPWAPAPGIDHILAAALERRDIQRPSGLLENPAIESVDVLFGSPVLFWSAETPKFELPLHSRSRWLTEARYVVVVSNGKRITVTRYEQEYRFESPSGNLELDLSTGLITLDLHRSQVSCLPEPVTIALAPENCDFAFYDLAVGEMLPYGDEKVRPGHAYALLSRSSLLVTVESPETRRVFAGEWVIRAYRNGIPPDLEIRRDGETLWRLTRDSFDSDENRKSSPVRVTCPGGRWGESAAFTVPALNDAEAKYLIVGADRVPLERSLGGAYRGCVALSPSVDYRRVRVRVECIWNSRLRWQSGELSIGPVQGVAIESEVGWRVLKEKNDIDAEFLRKYRVLTALPSRYDGDDVSDSDWAWMEGTHFCGRPRASATSIGGALHAVGEPLRLSVGPYNHPIGGYRIARSVIHSGVIGRTENTGNEWQIQLRWPIELGPDHEIWLWRAGAAQPEIVERTRWRYESSICHVQLDTTVQPLALAIAFQGEWLGARTCRMGWAGFAELIQYCQDWQTTAEWLKWWRVPLLHEALGSVTSQRVKAAPIETLRAWMLHHELSSNARFSEQQEDGWRSVTRSFLWDWNPSESESATILTDFGFLTGELDRDLARAWESCEELVATHPVLLAQAAARGVQGIYAGVDPEERSMFVERLRNRVLDIHPAASREGIYQAQKEAQRRAAEAMAVDELFVSRSLLPDALALVRGRLENHHNLRVAIANSQAVPKYLFAAMVHKMIQGEI